MSEEVKKAREVYLVPDTEPGSPPVALHDERLLDYHANGEKHRIAYAVSSRVLPGQVDEVFVLADSPDEARFIDRRLNDPEALALKRRRLAHVRDQGEVNEVMMPGTHEAIYSEVWRMADARERRAADRPETRSLTVDSLDLTVDTLEVKLDKGGRSGHIKLNGQMVPGVQTLTVECSVYERPKVTMTIVPTVGKIS
jgi:hypothetical protein